MTSRLISGKNPYHRSAVAAVAASLMILLFGWACRMLAAQLGVPVTTTPIASNALGRFPMRITDWLGRDVPLDDAIVRRTDADALINRRYSHDCTEAVSFYLACGTDTTELIRHRPEVCYPQAGWMPISRSTIELPLNGGAELPCTIFQFSRRGLDVERVTVLHYFIVHGQPCREVPLLLQSRIRRAFSLVDCVGQVQIVASSMETLSNELATKLVCAFASDSAAEIIRLFGQVEIDVKADRLRPREVRDKRR